MSMLSRLKAAASLTRIAGKVAVGTMPDDQSLTQTYGLLRGLYPAARGEPPKRGTQERINAYNDMPWLRACAERVATAIASVQWQLFVDQAPDQKPRKNKAWQRADYYGRLAIKKDLESQHRLQEIESHVFLDKVIDSGNSFLTGHACRKVTQLHIDLAGEAFWLKERDRLGTLIGVWPIPPHWIIATPTPTHRYFRVAYRAWIGDIPDTEILWMSNPDPVLPYGRGTGLGGTLADELETDEYASRFLKQFFFNDATPPFIVSPKGQDMNSVITDAEARRLEASWLSRVQGYWRAHRPVFTNRAVEITPFNRDLRSLQMVPLREHERDVVRQTFGIPPEILGILEHSNRATVDAADYIMSRYVLLPRLEFLRTYFQEKLIPEYDERLIVDYVSPVQEDHASQLDAAKAAPWALNVNEWRSRMGEPEVADGNVRLVPLTLTPIAVFSDAGAPSGAENLDEEIVAAPGHELPTDTSEEGDVQQPDPRKPASGAIPRDAPSANAAIMREGRSVQVNIDLHQPAVSVTVPERSVTVESPTVTVQPTIEVPAPEVTVEGASIHVDGPTILPTVQVQAEPKTLRKRVKRDDQDRIVEVIEERE